MKKDYFWILSAVFLIIIANIIEPNALLRIALFANAIIIIIDIIKTIRSNYYGREKEKN